MCGRYTITRPADVLDEIWDALDDTALAPPDRGAGGLPPSRYNLAPTQAAPLVVRDDSRAELTFARWGFRSRAGGAKPVINARLETVAGLPTFADSFVRRRCLVPADGFYEWSRSSGQPHWFSVPGRAGFCFAGMWEPGRFEAAPAPTGARPAAELGSAFCILTTRARPPVEDLHDRMPVILAPQSYGLWLAQGALSGADLQDLAGASESIALERRPVSPRVNRVDADDPSLLEASEPAPENLSLF
jgi:putative SOS response-associated peptidase YedK